ncbi:MAG: rhodanese-like domain-containing protein [Propionibacteriaceae bacterium]|jgi:rhodanese-related sulfurtransferase|nr:rhodanese-like domain-containing protein [Propionibacteriaceae bacterium]
MKRFRLFPAVIVGLALAFGLTACSDDATGQDKITQLKEEKGRVDVTSAEAEALIVDTDLVNTMVIFDIRTAPEYQAGHIANAYSVEVESPTFGTALTGFSKAAIYMVYGTDKDDTRAASAADQMVAYGIEKVFVLTDGYDGWTGEKVVP